PTSRQRGGTSCPRCGRTPTWSRPCSGASKSSSTTSRTRQPTDPPRGAVSALGSVPMRANRWNYLVVLHRVVVHEEHPVPGAAEFLAELAANDISLLVLTNNSIYTPRDLRARLARSGLDVPEESIYTSALATAQFLDSQRPNGSAYVIGEAGLTTALHALGYVMTDRDPDSVVLAETRTSSSTPISSSILLVDAGAKFIASNPDAPALSRAGLLPATGSVAALIERATGRSPHYVGKPNP